MYTIYIDLIEKSKLYLISQVLMFVGKTLLFIKYEY